jgi:DNA mismatch repair protein MutS
MIYKEYFDLTEEFQRQYSQTGALVLMQVGSFYEMYGLKTDKNEVVGSNVFRAASECCLKIADKKDRFEWRGSSYPLVMAGFGEASLDKYLPVLVDAGFSVAVYIQEDDMAKRGGKKRVFYGVFSAGMNLMESTSPVGDSNHVMVVWVQTFRPLRVGRSGEALYVCAFATTDTATGESFLYEYTTPVLTSLSPTSFDELERAIASFRPKELVFLCHNTEESAAIQQFIGAGSCRIVHAGSIEDEKPAKLAKPAYVHAILQDQFGSDQALEIFQQYGHATMAFCYLLDFLRQHSPHWVEHIRLPVISNPSSRVVLGNHTLKQLNVVSANGSSDSLLALLDKTLTPMGKKAFHHTLLNPVLDPASLETEYDAIDRFLSAGLVAPVRKILQGRVGNVDQILRFAVHGKGGANHVAAIVQAGRVLRELLHNFPELATLYPCKELPQGLENQPAQSSQNQPAKGSQNQPAQNGSWASAALQVATRFEAELAAIVDIDALLTGSDDVVLPGVDPVLTSLQGDMRGVRGDLEYLMQELNRLVGQDHVRWHDTVKSGASLCITATRGKALQKVLAGGTGSFVLPHGGATIPYAELRIAASGSSEAAGHTIQSGTLSTLFRRLAGLEEQVAARRVEVWRSRILAWIVDHWMESLQRDVVGVLRRLDVLQSKAWVASEYSCCRPSFGPSLEAVGLRHPIIEQISTAEIYVANDVRLGGSDHIVDNQVGCCTVAVDKNFLNAASPHKGILLYGTNAVGKTSLIKSVGLAVLMAQAGMYVAANRFVYKPYRAIYSRILGNDDLFRGLSTFVVEMSELRTVLVEAGPDVLVLGDEVCSGTESESGLSIMMATLQHLVARGAHFLFATHLHELANLDEMHELGGQIGLFHMAVRFDGASGRLVYDRKLKPGPGPATYGLEVAKSLSLPTDVLDEAFRLREKYFPHARTILSMEPTRYNRDKIRRPLCETCGAPGEETHHIQEQRTAGPDGFIRGGESDTPFHKHHAANLRTLCAKCHDAEHHAEKHLPL